MKAGELQEVRDLLGEIEAALARVRWERKPFAVEPPDVKRLDVRSFTGRTPDGTWLFVVVGYLIVDNQGEPTGLRGYAGTATKGLTQIVHLPMGLAEKACKLAQNQCAVGG